MQLFTHRQPGEIVFDNDGTENNPKTISNTGTGAITFFDMKVEDKSYVETDQALLVVGSSFEVAGSGSFKATAGTIEFNLVGSPVITTSSGATLEFNNLTIGENTATTATTTSDFKVNGNINVGTGGVAASFIAASPSTITIGGTCTVTDASSVGTSLVFNSIVVEDDASFTNTEDFEIEGDLTVEGDGSLTAGGTSEVVFDADNTKTINNEGTVTFYDLTIGDADSNPLVNTTDDIIVTNTLTIFSATSGLVCSGNSTVRFETDPTTPSLCFDNSNSGTLEFQNILFELAANAVALTPSSSHDFTVKGDIIVGANDVQADAGLVTFAGTSMQRIISAGAGGLLLHEVEIDNVSGVRAEMDLSTNGTGASAWVFTSGDYDLYGNNKVDFTAQAPVITEVFSSTEEHCFVNSLPGEVIIGVGGSDGGYVEVGDGVATANTELDATNIGISGFTSGATDEVVRRYITSVKIEDRETVGWIFKMQAGTFGAVSAKTVLFPDGILNGNTVDNIEAFQIDDGSVDVLTQDIDYATLDKTVGWIPLSFAAPTDAEPNTIVSAPVHPTLGTNDFLALVSRELTLAEWSETGNHTDYDLAPTTLIAGSTSQILFRFKLSSNSSVDVTALTINANTNLAGILDNIDLFADVNNNTSNSDGASLGATVTVTGSQIIVTGLSETVAAGSDEYYYLVADATSSVNSSSPNINFTLTEDDLTTTDCELVDVTLTSQQYSFEQQTVIASSSNTPPASYLLQGTSNVEVFGFSLTGPANSPGTDFTQIRIKVDLANGTDNTEITSFSLVEDVDKNGIYFDDGVGPADDDIILGTVDPLPGDGYLTFTGAPLDNITEDEVQYLVICDIESDATDEGTLQMSIESVNDVIVTSPGVVQDDSPWDGNVFIVKETTTPATEPTKLVVTGFSMNSYAPTPEDPGKTGLNVVTGEQISITIEAQDDNGVPRNPTTATNVQVNITGTATKTNFTATIPTTAPNIHIPDFQLDNALGYGPINITVTPTSGMTGLTDATYDAVTLFAEQPADQVNTLAAPTITATTVALTWVVTTDADDDGVIIVAKEGSAPTAPEDGIVYNAATGNNFSSPAATNGTTGTGSIVVFRGSNAATGVTIQGLDPSTKYYFAAYPYQGGTTSNSKPNYITEYVATDDFQAIVSATTKDSEPTVASSNLTFSDVTTSSMKVTWTNGNGEKRIVVAKAGSAPSTAPSDGTSYTANAVFGDTDTRLDDGFVVYNGNQNTVEVSNLKPNVDYYFYIYEYNGLGDDINYYATAGTGNRLTLGTEPTIQASVISFDEMTSGINNQVTLNWVRGNGDKVLVVGKAGSPIATAEIPADFTVEYDAMGGATAFGTGDAIGDGYVVYRGTAGTIDVTGLQYGQTYYFRAFEYNDGFSSDNSDATLVTLNYLTSTATDNPNSRIADSYEVNDDIANATYFGQANGSILTGIISNASDVDYLYIEPRVADEYKNIRIKVTSLPKNYTLELYDEDGRLLRQSQRTSTDDEIVVINNVPVGTYYIKIYSESGEFSLTPYRVSALESQIEYKSETP